MALRNHLANVRFHLEKSPNRTMGRGEGHETAGDALPSNKEREHTESRARIGKPNTLRTASKKKMQTRKRPSSAEGGENTKIRTSKIGSRGRYEKPHLPRQRKYIEDDGLRIPKKHPPFEE